MVDRAPTAEPISPHREPSDETLDTSRLLVELLHAAYAVRRESVDGSHAASGTIAAEAPDGTTVRPISEHAVRAAIHVYRHGDRTVGQIAAGLGISYGWASRVVEELEAAHYVTRMRDVDDRRVVHVQLETSAHATVEAAYHWHSEAVEAALKPMSQVEQTAVRGFLRRLTDQLNGGRAGRP